MAKLTKIKEDKGVRKEIKERRYSREELREIWSNRKDRGQRSKRTVGNQPRKDIPLRRWAFHSKNGWNTPELPWYLPCG